MGSFSENIISNLRKIMKDRGLRQVTVGGYAGISESQMSRILSGGVQLSLNQLADIASGLNMSVVDVISYPDRYVLKEGPAPSDTEIHIHLNNIDGRELIQLLHERSKDKNS